MIGGRSFFSAIKSGCGSCLTRQNLPKSCSPFNNLRSLGTLSASGSSNRQGHTTPQVGEMKLINKRFAHYGNQNVINEGATSGWSLISKLVAAAVGTIIGCGGKSLWDHNDIRCDGVLKNFHASCAPKDKDCVELKCEDSPCLRKMDCEEELIVKANSDLEKVLKEVKAKAIEYTEAAMKSYCGALDIMQQYLNQGYCIIEADDLDSPQYEEAWCCLYKIAKERCEKVKDALQKGQCAWELLCRLREVIESGKNCKYTSCNPLLVTAEESLTCAEKELLQLKARMDCIAADHEMPEQYQQVIDRFRSDLKRDVSAIVDSGKCEIQYAEQETALMIMQAYKKVIRAHKDVAQVMICTGNIPERAQQTVC